MSFVETAEQRQLRRTVADFAAGFGFDYLRAKARERQPLHEVWREAGRLGFLGVNVPEAYGGGGAGIYELSLVMEELSAAGAGMLMLVVSSGINATVISRFGTEEQKRRWLPGIADGTSNMAFAITEPDAGSNSHRITTIARRAGADWILNGRKVFISAIDQGDNVLVVGRTETTADSRAGKTGRLMPALFVVPRDARGFEYTPIEMELQIPDRQYNVFIDDVRLPGDALVGSVDAGLMQLFAGLNPERIMGAATAVGVGRLALSRAVNYAKERRVWRDAPIGMHQGIAHPLARNKVELELAKLMMQKAAALYDAGDDMGAAEAANMAKYAAAEASVRAVDQAVHTLGGNGLTTEYGLATLLNVSRIARIAPVSREMILNFVAQYGLGLPKSY
jgi:alkylation response protein AidB-like acyl-CoA dehydrogenase